MADERNDRQDRALFELAEAYRSEQAEIERLAGEIRRLSDRLGYRWHIAIWAISAVAVSALVSVLVVHLHLIGHP